MKFKLFFSLFILLFVSLNCVKVKANEKPTPVAIIEPYLLVSTLQGSLFAIGKRSGIIKWQLREKPIVDLPLMPTGAKGDLKVPLFLPDPKDGSLYRLNSDKEGNHGDVVEKLPFTLSELVALSPCRSKDGLFFIGKKVDSWFGVNKDSGEKVSLDGDRHVCSESEEEKAANKESFCTSNEKLLLVTKSEYQVSVYDLKTKHKIWNLTVVDYANTANAAVEESHYDIHLLSSSKAGQLIAVDPLTKNVIWRQSLGSSILSMFEFNSQTPFGHMLRVPFVTLSEDYLNSDLMNMESIHHELHPGLFIDVYDPRSSFALAPMTTERIPLGLTIEHYAVVAKRQMNDNENESGEDLNDGPHKMGIHFPGYYEIKGFSNMEISPMDSVPMDLVDDDGFFSNLMRNREQMNSNQKQANCVNKNSVQNKDQEKDNGSHCSNNKSQAFIKVIEDTCSESEADGPHIVVIISLWHWWREILALSILFAVMLNVLLVYLKRKCKSVAIECPMAASLSGSGSGCHVGNSNNIINNNVEVEEQISQPSQATRQSNDSAISCVSTSRQSSSESSRFEKDFEVIRRLGKGGYGLVIEARNRIDTCHYAIKIILLPMRAECKAKVLREVKALAKLDHRGIVRFYNSWLEDMPTNLEKSSLNDMESSGMSSLFASFMSNNNSVLNKASINETRGSSALIESLNDLSFGLGDTKSVETENDSYVVFENSKHEEIEKSIRTSEEEATEVSLKSEKSEKKERPKSLSLTNGRQCLFIQMQLCQKDTLREWLQNNSIRDRKFMFEVFVQIVNAVNHVHGMGLMHRDLKPSNIFFAADGIVKIGDFGLVTAASEDAFFHTPEEYSACKNLVPGGDEKHTNRVGTHLYMSPEQLRGARSYTDKVDIYSLGVIFFEMLVPFQTDMERVTELQNVRKCQFPQEFQSQHSTECEFLRKLLSNDPNERPAADDILQHSLFKQIDENLFFQERSTRRRTISSHSS